MKILKICLVILCLLHVRAVGLPRFSGATFFMKEIKLNHGFVTFVDDEDYEWLTGMGFKWRVVIHGRLPYAVRTCRMHRKDGRMISMHRSIMTPSCSSVYVDHKNRNTLDNQKHNLRFCTSAQNCHNRNSAKNSSSKYLGVSFYKRDSNWVVKIAHNYKNYHVGYFESEIEAAIAYNKKAIELHGQFASLNQI